MEDLHRKVKTVMLTLLWVSMGLYLEVGGPTLLDLKLHFNATHEGVARAVSAQGVGIFLGAAISGLTVDVLGRWKDLIVTFAQLLTVIATMCVPFVGNLTVLWFVFLANGMAAGAVNVAGQRILLEMWKEKAPSPMHALHMGFGIGALVTPLITNNFLAVLKFGDGPGDLASLNITANQSHSTTENGVPYLVVQETRVQYAFITIALMAGFLSIPFFIYPFYTCYAKRSVDEIQEIEDNRTPCFKLLQLLNPSTYADGSLSFGVFMFVVIFILYMNLVGAEQLFGNFIRTFSVDQLNFRREEASYLDTAYWASFTVGRFVGSILSHFIPIRILVIVDVLLNLVAVTLLDIFSANSHILLWTFTVLVGLMIAPLFPACISFVNTYIEVGGIVLTLVMFASGSGHFLYVWLAGVLYDKHGPRMLLYAMQTSAVLIVMICAVLITKTFRRRNRFEKAMSESLFTSESLQDVSYSRLKNEED